MKPIQLSDMTFGPKEVAEVRRELIDIRNKLMESSPEGLSWSLPLSRAVLILGHVAKEMERFPE